MRYEVTPNALQGPLRLELGDDALLVERVKKGVRDEFAYSDIEQIQLLNPLPNAWELRLRVRGGGRLTLSSRHFLGPGRFEDRSASYLPFVLRLHELAPGATRVAGSNTMLALGAGMLAVAVALVAFVLGRGGPRGGLGIAALVGVVGTAFVRQGGSRSYEQPPASFLPEPPP